MSSKTPEELRAKLERLGEATVRSMLKRGGLREWKVEEAEAWLAELDRVREERERLFGHILLEPRQEELFTMMVDASRALSEPAPFRTITGSSYGHGHAGLIHKGLPAGSQTVYLGDLDTMAGTGLLSLSRTPKGRMIIDVSPLGFKYYEELKRRMGQAAERMEATIRQSLLSSHFQEEHRAAYDKWAAAETLLWRSDVESQLSTIGHYCREAVILFVNALVSKYRPPNVPSDTQKYLNRMAAVIAHLSSQLGEAEREALDAFANYWEAAGRYWEAVNRLIVRQEHGAQREQEVLTWLDGRRVVFMTAVMLYETDAAVSRIT